MVKKLSSKTVYENKWMTVREDQVEFAGGQTGIYGVVEKPDFSLIIPFDGQHFYIVKQYRYPVEGAFWEFPQGSYEESPETDPWVVALGELKEETGLVAGKMEEIGFLYEAYGYCNQGFHIYLAQDVRGEGQELQASEAGMKVKRVSAEELGGMILSGEMRDAPSVSAYGVYKLHLAKGR